MQKRILSMILAIVLIVSLFPFSAVATDGQAAESVLKMHTTWEDPVVDCNMQLPYSWTVRFYLHHSDGSMEPVDPQDLVLPDFLTIEYQNEDGWFDLRPIGLGHSSITFTKNGETYSFPVLVHLPNIGLYEATLQSGHPGGRAAH